MNFFSYAHFECLLALFNEIIIIEHRLFKLSLSEFKSEIKLKYK